MDSQRPGSPGSDAVAADIALDAMDMELLIKLLHGETPLFFWQHYTAVLQCSDSFELWRLENGNLFPRLAERNSPIANAYQGT